MTAVHRSTRRPGKSHESKVRKLPSALLVAARDITTAAVWDKSRQTRLTERSAAAHDCITVSAPSTRTKGQLVTSGSVDSKLNQYLNSACFATPPVISADGTGTAFGDSGTGIVNRPGQANADLALSKAMGLSWPEGSDLLFRAEFFNTLNHPQFANPDTEFGSPTFGDISGTSVNARIGQLAIKFSFYSKERVVFCSIS
jgi:hypothetical protein